MPLDPDELSAKANSELRFQKLLMNTNTDLFFVKDKDFKIVEANEAFLSVYPEEQRDKVIGYTTLEAYSEEQVEEFTREDRKAFEEGMSEVIETIDFPDGQQRVLLTKKTRFENDEGEAFILGCARDITSLKKVENELIEVNEELEEFAYRTSHDLRSPLLSSIQILNVIEQDIKEQNGKNSLSYLQIVKRSLGGLERLVDDILTLTKAKKSAEDIQVLDLNILIKDALSNTAHMSNFEQMNISVNVEGQGKLASQKSRITLILENLISNAVKYQDSEKAEQVLRIKVEDSNNGIIICIQDNGIGIPKEQQDKLFTMFQRFHPRVAFGSGLGLYMVKKSVGIVKGKIGFDDSEMTTFTIHLPNLN